jgi:protein disulfide-isomerase
MRKVAFVALMGCLLSWTAVASARDRIAWVPDWRDARDIAKRQHRLVLLHFYSDTCIPCKELEKNVFPRVEVARAMSTGYVAVKINVDRFPQLRDHYKISAVPADVIVSAEGKEIARSVPSPADPNRYIAMLDSARAQFGIGSHLNQQIAVNNTAGHPENRYGTGGFGAAAANNSTPTGYRESRGSNFSAQSTAPTQHQSFVANQYTEGFAPQGPAEADVSPRYGNAYPGQSVAPQSNLPRYGEAPSVTSNVAPNQGISQNPYATRPATGLQNQNSIPASNNRVANNPNSIQGNRAQTQPPRQEVRTPPAPTSSQFIMDGFCPVTLVEQAKWQQGDTRWGAVHQGKTYLFASQQSQQKFLATPDRFAPVLSGYDPVRSAESRQLVEGRREHGVFFANRIFLFADEAALDRFSQNTEFYMVEIRQASANPRRPSGTR